MRGPRPHWLIFAALVVLIVVSGVTEFTAAPATEREVHEHGLEAGLWNLMETEESLQAVTGVDPDFLTTNRPDLAVQLYEE